MSLGPVGIEGREVHTIPYEDICAVVHDGTPEPYQSDDHEVIKAWVLAHHGTVEAAWARLGTVLPLGFGTVIKGESGGGSERNVARWLTQEHGRLKHRLDKVRGKAEYGVQVFWDLGVVAQNLAQTSPEIRKMEEDIRTRSKGVVYMYRQRLENLVKGAVETRADECFKDFYRRISQHADEVKVEKTKKPEHPLQMIMNLSCLVHGDRYEDMGKELDKIAQMEGFSVRFTGPWPPYSFASDA